MSKLKDVITENPQTVEQLVYINQHKKNAELAGCRLITLRYVEYNLNTEVEVDMLRIGVQYNIPHDQKKIYRRKKSIP